MGDDLTTLTTRLAVFGLNWLVQSTVLLVLGLAAGRLARGRGPAIQSALYRTTLAAVLVCPIASALLAASGVAGVTLPRPTSAAPMAPRIVDVPSSEPPEFVRAAAVKIGDPRPVEIEPIAAREASRPTRRFTLSDAVFWGVAAWMLGTLFLLARLVILEQRMRKLRATALPAEAEAGALCEAIASRLNVAAPTALASPFLFSPCLVGLLRPAILLPEDVGANLHDALVHELAHLARRDGLWNLPRRLAVAVLWFQPLLWGLSRRLEATAEEVCDDHVVAFGGDRAEYAGLLVELAGRALPPRSAAAVGMISVRSTLSLRVARILDASRSPSTRAGRQVVFAMLAVGLASTAFASLLGVVGRPSPAEGPNAPAAGVPITGRIVDLEGRPVAGVVVKVGGVEIPKGDDLTAWIERVRNGAPPWVAAERIDWDRKAPEAEGREATTDADGRFRFEGLGADRVVGLSLRGETVAYATIDVVSRKIAPFPAKGFANQHGPGVQTVYGADFTYTAVPGLAVEGVVKDGVTGEPLADAGVWSYRFAGSNYVGTTALKSRTDDKGRFRLTGLPKSNGNVLLIVPNDDQPYLMQEFELPDPKGTGPLKAEVAMHKGVWIEGKLTERETGKPIPDAWLHYLPFLTNTFAQAIPEFGKGGNSQGVGYQDRYKSKPDGSFRLVGLPGRAIVGAVTLRNNQTLLYMQGAGSESIAGMAPNDWFETYSNPVQPGKLWPTVMKEIDPPADARTAHVDLQATQGDSVRVRIAAPGGRPVKGIETIGRISRGAYDHDALDDPESDVSHLYPGEERIVMFRHDERKLGKVVRLKKGDDAQAPVAVTLEPLASLTGRVVDHDGVPISGATIRTDLLPSGGFSPHLSEVSTDENGRFIVLNVPIGCDYALVIRRGFLIKPNQFAFVKRVVVKPGETTDVGEVRLGKK